MTIVEEIQIRCPAGPQRLMAILRHREKYVIVEDNLIEFACNDCARWKRKEGDPVWRVLHRYNLLGELVETEVVYKQK